MCWSGFTHSTTTLELLGGHPSHYTVLTWFLYTVNHIEQIIPTLVMADIGVLPLEILALVVLNPVLQDTPGIVRQVCRAWRDIVDTGRGRHTSMDAVMDSASLLHMMETDKGVPATFPWHKACRRAAETGNRAVLEWLKHKDTPWFKWTSAWAYRHPDVAGELNHHHPCMEPYLSLLRLIETVRKSFLDAIAKRPVRAILAEPQRYGLVFNTDLSKGGDVLEYLRMWVFPELATLTGNHPVVRLAVDRWCERMTFAIRIGE